MDLLNRIFNPSPHRKKIRVAKKEMNRILLSYSKDVFKIEVLETVDINPCNLSFIICVNTDAEKQRLEKTEELITRLKSLLIENNYPRESVEDVFFGFESQETVDRESKGSWYLHLK